MNFSKTTAMSLAVIGLIGCSDNASDDMEIIVPTEAGEICSGNVFASGTVSREFTSTAWNEPFVASGQAHVRLQLSTAFVDGPTTTLVEQDTPFTTLPFDFSICAEESDIEMMRLGELFITVEVFNHEGFESRVGDLVSESANTV